MDEKMCLYLHGKRGNVFSLVMRELWLKEVLISDIYCVIALAF